MQPPETLLGLLPRELREMLVEFLPCTQLFVQSQLHELASLKRVCMYAPESRGVLCECAARDGNLSLLQWARRQGCPCGIAACAAAAHGGQLDVLRWLHENDCPWNAETCYEAARGGHITVLQYLRENGCTWNKFTCGIAARYGHLAVLQWLRANDCPWDMGTCESAAVGGHLEVLQWARANSCPWDRRKTEHSAQLYLHDHVYAWIRQQPLKDDDVPTPEPQPLLPVREYFAS
jgi:hypothetical protein